MPCTPATSHPKVRLFPRTTSGWLFICGILSLAPASKSEPSATVPPGAVELGYTKRVINEHPTTADIAPSKNGPYKWFSGQWYARTPPSLDHYQTTNGVLQLSLDGDLASVPRNFSAGQLPLLAGEKGFYVEFDVWLSDNDPDHWPAVWLMPVEHNNKQQDHYGDDPVHFERWMELDVDEGGFGPGLLGTVLSWTEIWPHYKRVFNHNHQSPAALDRTHPHTFGASYDPVHQQVTWWLDGVRQMSAGAPAVPAIAIRQHFYLIIGAQSHGARKAYRMYVSGVRAFVPPDSPLPPL